MSRNKIYVVEKAAIRRATGAVTNKKQNVISSRLMIIRKSAKNPDLDNNDQDDGNG